MAAKKIEIIYDINGKAIDVAIEKTLNLQQQAKALTAELRKTSDPEAFKILSSRLGDVQDGLARTSAKSKDLFSSLSMLPGPIGQFFSQLQGGIELLKTFSSFTFKDLAFQFKETANDIGDISKNISGIDTDGIDKLNDSGKETSNTLSETAAQAAATSSAISSTSKATEDLANKSLGNVKVQDKLSEIFQSQVKVYKEVTYAGAKTIVQLKALDGTVVKLTEDEARAAIATYGLAEAEGVATVATRTLGTTIKTVLISTGIGIAIVLIGELVAWLYKMATSEEAAAEATKKLNHELENQNLLLDLDTKAAKRRHNEAIALMKAQGKSESEIRKESIKNAYEDYDIAYKAEEEARKTYNANLGKVDAEGLKAMEKNLTDREQATKDAYSSYIVLGYNQKAEELKVQEQKNKELQQKNQEHLKKVASDNKTANETEITNQREIGVLKLTEDRDRQKKELENQKLAEMDKINALEISTKRKGELNAQIEEKYGYKLKDLNKKFKDEDIKAAEEFTVKLGEITISAIKDETDRQIAARQEKYSNDLKELEKDKEFIKLSEETKAHYRAELKTALDNDVAKIKHDARVKELDDELKFMQIRNEGIRKGTMAFFDAQRELLDKSQQRELEQLDLTEQQKTDIKNKYAALRKDIDKQEFETYVGYVSAGLSTFGNFISQQQQINSLAMSNELAEVKGNAEAEDKIKEKYFYKNRDAQVGQAIISTLQSAISAYSSLAVIPVVGPALGAAAAAAALIFGYKQVDLIKAQKYQSGLAATGGEAAKPAMANYGKNYGDGGMIDGPRHASGGVMINAEGGEAVMTRGAVTMFAPLLSAMNQMGGGTSFNKGALGQAGYDHPKVAETGTPQPMIVKTYVVSSELTTDQHKQARLKDLSTL